VGPVDKQVSMWQPGCMSIYSPSVNVDAFFVYTSPGDQEMRGRDVGEQGKYERFFAKVLLEIASGTSVAISHHE